MAANLTHYHTILSLTTGNTARGMNPSARHALRINNAVSALGNRQLGVILSRSSASTHCLRRRGKGTSARHTMRFGTIASGLRASLAGNNAALSRSSQPRFSTDGQGEEHVQRVHKANTIRVNFLCYFSESILSSFLLRVGIHATTLMLCATHSHFPGPLCAYPCRAHLT